MLTTSENLNRLTESATLRMAQLSRELKNKGVDVIGLSLGEPDFNAPPHVKEAAKKAVDGNFDGYPPVPGYQDLREAICQKLKRDNNLDYKPEQIIVSTGAKQSIANIFISYINEGDEVIIPAPYWVTYPELVNMMNGKCVFIPSTVDTNFKVSADQIEAAITPKTKFLIYSSPSNPAGSVYSQEELEAIASVLERHPHVYVISDEIYEYINYVGRNVSIAEFPSIKDRVIVVNGQAKGFAMTGWRIGYIAAPLDVAKACNKLQGQLTSATCSIAQRATIAALTGPMDYTYNMREQFQKRRDIIVDLAIQIEGVKCNVPEGAFYIFPDVSFYFGKSYNGNVIKNGNDLCMFLLEVAHVAVVDGESFGSPECIRISYAASEDNIRTAMSRIKTALEKLV
jgi:aspartate aminotransferase